MSEKCAPRLSKLSEAIDLTSSLHFTEQCILGRVSSFGTHIDSPFVSYSHSITEEMMLKSYVQ